MDVIETLPAIGATGLAATVAIKAPELLKEIYGDLAKPGVSQVGSAISTLLGLGNTILIPLRLLNDTAREFEKSYFEKIANRFSKIPIDEVNAIPPEVGVRTLENLAATRDPDLQKLYIELLASAATEGDLTKAHPAFIDIIGSMCPDEARLLSALQGAREHPFITIEYKIEGGAAKRTLFDLVFEEFEGIKQQGNLPLYISNFSGLGLIEIRRDTHLTDSARYDRIINRFNLFNNIAEQATIDGKIYHRSRSDHIIMITSLGQSLIEACLPKS